MRSNHLFTLALCMSLPSFAEEKQGISRRGLYVGAGLAYDTVQVTQSAWGQGIAGFYVNSTQESLGNAQGNGTPFSPSVSTFSPEVQTGFYQYIGKSDYLYGVKFLYTYLGLKTDNYDLYVPQEGEVMDTSTQTISPLFGYVITKAVKVTNNHELALLAYIGKEVKQTQIYLGVGPALFSMKSYSYDSIGYAVIGPDTLNMTGLINYGTPALWTWGGAAQLGINCFLSSKWFLDFSYTYAISGKHQVFHQQPFYNTIGFGDSGYTSASGTIKTKNKMKIISQSFIISINRLFSW